jgi:hypothetical protein
MKSTNRVHKIFSHFGGVFPCKRANLERRRQLILLALLERAFYLDC